MYSQCKVRTKQYSLVGHRHRDLDCFGRVVLHQNRLRAQTGMVQCRVPSSSPSECSSIHNKSDIFTLISSLESESFSSRFIFTTNAIYGYNVESSIPVQPHFRIILLLLDWISSQVELEHFQRTINPLIGRVFDAVFQNDLGFP